MAFWDGWGRSVVGNIWQCPVRYYHLPVLTLFGAHWACKPAPLSPPEVAAVGKVEAHQGHESLLPLLRRGGRTVDFFVDGRRFRIHVGQHIASHYFIRRGLRGNRYLQAKKIRLVSITDARKKDHLKIVLHRRRRKEEEEEDNPQLSSLSPETSSPQPHSLLLCGQKMQKRRRRSSLAGLPDGNGCYSSLFPLPSFPHFLSPFVRACAVSSVYKYKESVLNCYNEKTQLQKKVNGKPLRAVYNL